MQTNRPGANPGFIFSVLFLFCVTIELIELIDKNKTPARSFALILSRSVLVGAIVGRYAGAVCQGRVSKAGSPVITLPTHQKNAKTAILCPSTGIIDTHSFHATHASM